MIDLLVEKIDVFREKLKITLRYTPQAPNHTPPKGKTEILIQTMTPTGTLPIGAIFLSSKLRTTRKQRKGANLHAIGKLFRTNKSES